MRVLLALLLVPMLALAFNPATVSVGDVTEKGTVVYVSGSKDDTVIDQTPPGAWSFATGSASYDDNADYWAADDFTSAATYDTYRLSGIDVWYKYWGPGTAPTTTDGFAVVWADDSGEPDGELDEDGSSSGWHDDVVNDGGGTDLFDCAWVTGWDNANYTETASGADWIFSASVDDSYGYTKGLGDYFGFDSTASYWFSFHKMSSVATGPYMGIRDYDGTTVTFGESHLQYAGAGWVAPSNAGDLAFVLYGVLDTGIESESLGGIKASFK